MFIGGTVAMLLFSSSSSLSLLSGFSTWSWSFAGGLVLGEVGAIVN